MIIHNNSDILSDLDKTWDLGSLRVCGRRHTAKFRGNPQVSNLSKTALNRRFWS